MLASITPLGERGRGQRWALTATAFCAGAVLSSVALGAALGALGSLVSPIALSPHARLAALAAAALVALALDARAVVGGRPVPGPRRQVDEAWLGAFRGWVYGGGFGAQLGLGVTTVVTSAAIYVTLLAAFLAGSAASAALVVGCLGAGRALSLLPAARITTPQRLLAVHRRLGELRRPVAIAALVGLSCVVVAALIGSLT